MEQLNRNNYNQIDFNSNPNESLAKLIKEKLVANKICGLIDIEDLNQKLKINALTDYNGNFFQNKENCCFVRYFENNPTVIALICEYEYDNKDYDVYGVETLLKDSLKGIGFNIINTSN